MRVRMSSAFAFAAAFVAFGSLTMPSIASAQDDATKKAGNAVATPQMSKEEEAAMAEMMQLGSPGDGHKVFAGLAGTYDVVAKMWMNPAAPPMESKGTSTKTVLWDGRYLAEEFSGDMMGAPFQGKSITGFDNQKKKYIGTWMDSMSTAIMYSEGTYDAGSKTLTLTSKMYDPMVKKEVPIRMVTKFVDPTTHVFEFYGQGPDGKEMKSMEITYKKKA